MYIPLGVGAEDSRRQGAQRHIPPRFLQTLILTTLNPFKQVQISNTKPLGSYPIDVLPLQWDQTYYPFSGRTTHSVGLTPLNR